MTDRSIKIIFSLLLFMALIWPFSFAIVNDFYPHLKGLRYVLMHKSWVNGLIVFWFACAYHERIFGGTK